MFHILVSVSVVSILLYLAYMYFQQHAYTTVKPRTDKSTTTGIPLLKLITTTLLPSTSFPMTTTNPPAFIEDTYWKSENDSMFLKVVYNQQANEFVISFVEKYGTSNSNTTTQVAKILSINDNSVKVQHDNFSPAVFKFTKDTLTVDYESVDNSITSIKYKRITKDQYVQDSQLETIEQFIGPKSYWASVDDTALLLFEVKDNTVYKQEINLVTGSIKTSDEQLWKHSDKHTFSFGSFISTTTTFQRIDYNTLQKQELSGEMLDFKRTDQETLRKKYLDSLKTTGKPIKL